MEENARVWVVEQGEYSDYHVVGVFSTRENAERVRDLVNDGDNTKDALYPASVAEWPLDPGIANMNAGRTPFHVVMAMDGTAERVEAREVDSATFHDRLSFWPRSSARAFAGRNVQDVVWGVVWATDPGHAAKIANEFRVRYLAERP